MSEETAVRVFNGAIFVLLFIGTFLALWSFDLTYILGHDEAVYATEARHWLIGTPSDQFEIYRPIAMPALGWLALHFGGTEETLRIAGVIFGAMLPGVTYLLFRQFSNIWVSFSVAFVAGTSYLFLQQAPRFLDDVPTTVLLLAIMTLIYMHYKSGGKSRSITLAAPLGALAFYLRYGAVTPLLMIVACSYFFLFPVFVRHKKPDFGQLGVTILLSVLLLVPHIVYSIVSTGEPLGILELAGKAAHRVYLGEGLIRYIDWLPKMIGGWVMGDTAILGAVCLLAMAPLRWRDSHVGLTWVGTIGITSLVLTGLLVHAEPRYILFPMILLSGVGIAGLYYLVNAWSGLVAYTLLGVLFVVAGNFAILHYLELKDFYNDEASAPYNTGYIQALSAVKDDARGLPCSVWTTLDRPRASWYSNCLTPRVTDKNSFDADMHAVPGLIGYSIVDTKESDMQITASSANSFGVALVELYRIRVMPDRDFIVYRIVRS